MSTPTKHQNGLEMSNRSNQMRFSSSEIRKSELVDHQTVTRIHSFTHKLRLRLRGQYQISKGHLGIDVLDEVRSVLFGSARICDDFLARLILSQLFELEVQFGLQSIAKVLQLSLLLFEQVEVELFVVEIIRDGICPGEHMPALNRLLHRVEQKLSLIQSPLEFLRQFVHFLVRRLTLFDGVL